MDPYLWRTVSYWVLLLGCGLVLAGTLGTWYFGNRVEEVAPYRQAIRTAAATLEVLIRTDEPFNNYFMDRGGYLAFGRGSEPILTTGAMQCRAQQQGDGRALFRGVFTMDAADRAVGRPVAELRRAEFVEMKFLPMPVPGQIIQGRAIITINSVVQLEIAIPEQITDAEGRFFVRNMEPIFAGFK